MRVEGPPIIGSTRGTGDRGLGTDDLGTGDWQARPASRCVPPSRRSRVGVVSDQWPAPGRHDSASELPTDNRVLRLGTRDRRLGVRPALPARPQSPVARRPPPVARRPSPVCWRDAVSLPPVQSASRAQRASAPSAFGSYATLCPASGRGRATRPATDASRTGWQCTEQTRMARTPAGAGGRGLNRARGGWRRRPVGRAAGPLTED